MDSSTRPSDFPDEPQNGPFERLVEFEFRTLEIPASMSSSEAKRLLTDHAEYGRWELARVAKYSGGRRTVTLRRKIIRIPRRV